MKHKNLVKKGKTIKKEETAFCSKIYPSMSNINPFLAKQLKYRLRNKKNKKIQ